MLILEEIPDYKDSQKIINQIYEDESDYEKLIDSEYKNIDNIEVKKVKRYEALQNPNDSALSWEEASKLCTEKGGQLATFETEEEWNNMVNVAKALSSSKEVNYFWIGGQTTNVNDGHIPYWPNGDDSTLLKDTSTRWTITQPKDQIIYEPSVYDRDKFATYEPYIMLWNIKADLAGGWTMNDISNTGIKQAGYNPKKLGYIIMYIE